MRRVMTVTGERLLSTANNLNGICYTNNVDNSLGKDVQQIKDDLQKINRRLSELMTMTLDIIGKKQLHNDRITC